MRPLNPLLRRQLQKHSHPRLARIAELSDFYDDLAELNELAYGITEPSSDADWLDAPVYIHGVQLKPLSLGAYMWVRDKAMVWFDPERRSFWANLCIAYAMAHSRSPRRLFKIRDAGACKSALRDWMRDCGCTYQELVDAIEQVLHTESASQDSESTSSSKKSEYGPVIALLCSEYGLSPKDVLWDMSLDTVQGLCDEYVAKIRAQEAAQKGKGHKPSSPAYVKACGLLNRALKQFRQKVEALDG